MSSGFPNELEGDHAGTPILLVEDEGMLRRSMAKGLSKLPRVRVLEAETVEEARQALNHHRPRLVLSDLNLPDGTGLEILQSMDEIGLFVPVLLVTAYMRRFRSMIPRASHIEVHEKPIPIDTLRSMVSRRLASRETGDLPTPFTAADYVQLADLGRRSVSITVDLEEDGEGEIVIWEGEAWWARDARGEGEEAFRRMVLAGTTNGYATMARCHPLRSNPLPRNIHSGLQSLLLESARMFDESSRDLGALAELPSEATPPPTPATPATRPLAASPAEFGAIYDEGIDALLRKAYEDAYEIFSRACRLNPDDPNTQANLTRLKEMGFGPRERS